MPETRPGDENLELTLRELCAGDAVFQRYRLAGVLGRGGMGVVWRARDEELSRDVALKFIPEQLVHDPEAVADLKRETSRCLELTHPNIVRIYDLAYDPRRVAISMELVDGGSLSLLKVSQGARCLEVDRVAPLMRQLLEGLEYAHESARIIHRDLKPANLMTNSVGRLKIADFGIASTMSDSLSRVSLKPASGTLPFMSPQQACGGPPAVTDDIYSFGATVYDLVTGKPPFYTGEILHQLERITPPPMSQRRAELGFAGEPIPPVWDVLIAACLAKDASARPQSAREIRAELENSTTVKVPVSGFAGPSTQALTVRVPPVSSGSAEGGSKSGRGVALLIGGVLAAVLLVGVVAAAGVVLFYVIPNYTHRTEVEPVRPIHVAPDPAPAPEPPEPPPAAPRPGRIVANTVPAGARVSVDGEPRGFSPVVIDAVSPGAHRLTLALDGYEPAELILEVAPEKSSDPGPITLTRKPIARIQPIYQTPAPAPPSPAPPLEPNTPLIPPAYPAPGSLWLYPDSSVRLLTRAELAALNADQLWRARNEIFARHGLIFSTPRGRAFAATLGNYYHPVDADQNRVELHMNKTEQANVDLIRAYESRR